MKKLILFIALVIPAIANQAVSGFCEQGNTIVTTAGLPSTTTVQGSFPSCTVSVFTAGTTTLISIFSDNLGTVLTNPFTANTSGRWLFYAANNQRVDIQLSGGGLPAPWSIKDVILSDPAVAITFAGANTFSGTNTFTGLIQCKNLENIACIDFGNSQGWSGTDVGGWINSAYAALPPQGGTIYVAASASGCYPFSTPIVLNTNGKIVALKGAGATATCLQYTPSTGIALTFDTGSQNGPVGILEDFELKTTVSGSTATGLSVGPTVGCSNCKINRLYIDGFQIETISTAFGADFYGTEFSNCSSAANSVALQIGGTFGDDNHVHGGRVIACATLVKITNGNPEWFDQLLLANATSLWVDNTAGGVFHCSKCHWFNLASGVTTNWFASSGLTQISNSSFEDAKTTGTPTSFATQTAGQLMMSQNHMSTAGETVTEFVLLSGSTTAMLVGNFIGTSATIPLLWNTSYTGLVNAVGNQNTGNDPSFLGGSLRLRQTISDQGTVCTNGELALSAGWQSTGTATVTAVAGNGQTCSWTITTGTTTAANPTVTDTLTNALPAATTVCEINIHGGTHTAAAGEGFQQTALSATAPIFTFNGTPTAGGTTYFVTRRCGP